MSISSLSGLGGMSNLLGGNSGLSSGLSDPIESIFQQANKKLEQQKNKLETQDKLNTNAKQTYEKQIDTEAKSAAPKFAGGQG